MEARQNIIVRVTDFSMHLFLQYIGIGDTVVDGTMGTGRDTLRLARLVGADRGMGKVYGFDVQEQALNETCKLLENCQIKHWVKRTPESSSRPGVVLIKDSHSRMDAYIKEEIDGAMFNLGYMPGTDKKITTKADTTIGAIHQSLNLLKKNGLVMAVIYGGHHEGAFEKKELLKYVSDIDASVFHAAHIDMINQSQKAPSILMITKKK